MLILTCFLRIYFFKKRISPERPWWGWIDHWLVVLGSPGFDSRNADLELFHEEAMIQKHDTALITRETVVRWIVVLNQLGWVRFPQHLGHEVVGWNQT